jgi:hypothetical protein
LGKVKRIFYPLGGSDISTVFSLFHHPHGGPEHVLIADAMPWGQPEQVRAAHRSAQAKEAFLLDKRQDGWSSIASYTARGEHGSAILWELEQIGARGIKVEYLDEHGRPRAPLSSGDRSFAGLRLSRDYVPTTYDPKTRDIVRVSFTLEGRPRALTYVQQDMLAPRTFPPLLKRFLREGFDAYVEKAPMMGAPGGTLIVDDPRYRAGFAMALRGLDREHGQLLTDRPLPSSGRMRSFGRGVLHSVDFGYGQLYQRKPWQADEALREWSDRVDQTLSTWSSRPVGNVFDRQERRDALLAGLVQLRVMALSAARRRLDPEQRSRLDTLVQRMLTPWVEAVLAYAELRASSPVREVVKEAPASVRSALGMLRRLRYAANSPESQPLREAWKRFEDRLAASRHGGRRMPS